MAIVQDLVDEIYAVLRPSESVEVTISQLQTFLNMAARDAQRSGQLIVLEDDESLTWTSNTYEYNVPASFAYVSELRVENTATGTSTWDEEVPYHFWSIRLDDSVPKFFISRGFPIPAGKLMKVVGQKRPTIYSSGATGLAETVDLGLESFLRDRAMSFALDFQATGNPTLEIDRTRLALGDRAFGRSEAMLARHPAENRVNPNAEYVPSR
jgi:hypothetical protein